MPLHADLETSLIYEIKGFLMFSSVKDPFGNLKPGDPFSKTWI